MEAPAGHARSHADGVIAETTTTGLARERVNARQRIAGHAIARGAVREGNEQQKRRGDHCGARGSPHVGTGVYYSPRHEAQIQPSFIE